MIADELTEEELAEIHKYDPDYDGKFTHMLCNGRYEELSREYKI